MRCDLVSGFVAVLAPAFASVAGATAKDGSDVKHATKRKQGNFQFDFMRSRDRIQ